VAGGFTVFVFVTLLSRVKMPFQYSKQLYIYIYTPCRNTQRPKKWLHPQKRAKPQNLPNFFHCSPAAERMLWDRLSCAWTGDQL